MKNLILITSMLITMSSLSNNKFENKISKQQQIQTNIESSEQIVLKPNLEDSCVQNKPFQLKVITELDTVINYEETPLILENWMTTENFFINNIDLSLTKEDTLELEDWMINENFISFPTAICKL